MLKQDFASARNVQDLERKYKFAEMGKNIESSLNSIIKINSELNNIFNSVTINLQDFLNDQSDFSLWFFEGVPTFENLPYSNWETPNNHEGDIYYNQLTGKAYQFVDGNWTLNNDSNLLSALALTNAELDVSTDHERQIFFTTPSVPYSCGDWWIKENGTLLICQISKTLEQEYSEEDFINSSKYTSNVATKIDNTITVLKGQVVEITENYAKFTDLSTAGSTIINGANIKSGTIDADLVTIANNNVEIGAEGIKLSNGAKVVGEYGLMNTYLYQKNDYVGTYDNDTKQNITFDVNIPSSLNVTKATITLIHTPVNWDFTTLYGTHTTVWGTCKNLKLYKNTNSSTRKLGAIPYSDINFEINPNFVEIENPFTKNDFTNNGDDSTYTTETTNSIDIKSHLVTGNNQLKIETGLELNSSEPETIAFSNTGYITAILAIEGFLSYT